MDMNPKVSIIVPVYKVEQYLKKCVDSIMAQTLTDFELILVDDGSPDNCGKICDDYAQRDSRVKVIHKENGGQASARNAALDIAKGEYIGFVDSDDWIEPDMYELLYNMCIQNNCEIANCSSMIYFKNKTVKNGGHSLTIHNREQGMAAMLEGNLYDEVVWTKLIKRSLLENIRFPTGVFYEDTAFTYKVIDNANRICCIGEPKYHYIKREESTMDRAIKNLKIDAVLIYDEMYQFIGKKYPGLTYLVALKLANSAMSILNLIAGQKNFNQFKKEYYLVTKVLNKYFSQTIRIKEFPKNVKLLLSAAKLQPLFYKWLVQFASGRSLS
jgi:glycosyltransferase involved in cell wall biosynthesis